MLRSWPKHQPAWKRYEARLPPLRGVFHQETTLITCFILYEMDPFKCGAFAAYRACLVADPAGRHTMADRHEAPFERQAAHAS